MKEKLQKIKEEALSAIAADSADLEQIRIQYLGKKGELTAVLRGMGALTAEERPVIGQLANDVRAEIEGAIKVKAEAQKNAELENKLASEKIDVTLPSNAPKAGKLHPLTQVQRTIEDIFIGVYHQFQRNCISSSRRKMHADA